MYTALPITSFSCGTSSFLASKTTKTKKAKITLAAFGKLRRTTVLGLLDKLVEKYGKTTNSYFSGGSTTLTFDLDVSVNGADKEDIVIEFNEQFEKAFGHPSADVFDSNLYASSAFEFVQSSHASTLGKDRRCKSPWTCIHVCGKNKSCKWISYIDAYGNPTYKLDQRVWAIYALLRHGGKEAVKDVTSPVFRKHLAQAERMIKRYTPDTNISRQNKRYANALRDHRRRRTRLEKLGDKATAKDVLSYANAVCTANALAQEAYVSDGPFRHVVGHIQGGYSTLPISHAHFFDSFIENLGEVYKVLDENKSCELGLLAASKYVSRAMDAITMALKDHVSLSDHDQDMILTSTLIKDTAEFARKRVRRRAVVDAVLLRRVTKALLAVFDVDTCDTNQVKRCLAMVACELIETYYHHRQVQF